MNKKFNWLTIKYVMVLCVVSVLLLLVGGSVAAEEEDSVLLGEREPTPVVDSPVFIDHPNIVGGEEVSPKYKYPWTVRIIIEHDGTSDLCTGSIINEYWIITAGHCVVYDQTHEKITVTVSEHNYMYKEGQEEPHETEIEPILHPEYSKPFLDIGVDRNDIALIKLEEKINFDEYAQPIILNDGSMDIFLVEGEGLKMAGWGVYDYQKGLISWPLKEIMEVVFTGITCNVKLPSGLHDNYICAHPTGSGYDGAAGGDSGGPLFTQQASGNYLLGITVAGEKFPLGINSDYFINVSSYYDWIRETIPPLFIDELLSPSAGDVYTQFNFLISYKDTFSRIPSNINLVIIDPSLSESPVILTPSGSDWENGVIYSASSVFTSPGEYEYYYQATVDGTQYRYPEDSNLSFSVTGQPTYTVSGYVKEGGSGLADVWVTDGFRGDMTDGSGFYSIEGVPNGSYTIQPAKEGYSFSPETRPVTVGDDNEVVSDFFGSPISIDNRIFYPVADTSISSINQTHRYGSDEQLWVGYNADSTFDWGLLRFDLSSLAGKEVYDVELSIYFNVDDGSAIDVSIREMEEDWPENIRYSEFDHSFSHRIAQNEESVSGSGWETWESTTLTYWVKDWIENPSTNYGILLYPEDNEGVMHGWLSKESANQDYWPRITLKVYNLDEPSDLYATAPEPTLGESSPFLVGQEVCWRVSVTNGGPGDSSYNDVGYYLSSTAFDYSSRIDEDKISPILAGETVEDDDFCYQFQPSDVGTKYFNIWVDDDNGAGTPGENDETDETNNQTYYGPFEVIVPNQTPSISGLPDHSYSEDPASTTTIDLWAYTTDDSPDDDLTFTINNSPATNGGVSITSNRYLEVNPFTNWNGSTTVEILVIDPQGAMDTDTFAVTVSPVNDVPWIDPAVPDQSEEQDQPIEVDLSDYENDIEDNGPALDWTVTGLDNASVSGQNSDDDVLTFTPTSGYIGSDTVTLTLTDSLGAVDTQSLVLTWREVITNLAPNTPTSPTPSDGISNVPVDQNFGWTGGDPDGDTVTYQVYLKPDGGSYSVFCTTSTTSSSVTCNPSSNLAQSTHYEWYVHASDGSLASTSIVWDFTTVDASPEGTTRISVDADGNQVSSGGTGPSISEDGRYVAFQSYANDLVDDDTNGTYDIFVKDRQTGAVELVSVTNEGVQPNAISGQPYISADGRYVVFYSNATNLVSNDNNSETDIFLKDRTTGAIELISVTGNGTQGNASSSYPSISADGRYVVFYSSASNFVPNDDNGQSDIFVKDRQTGVLECISIGLNGKPANSKSDFPRISSTGRFVTWVSKANNLVPNDDNGVADIFVKDLQTDSISLVTLNAAGEQVHGGFDPSISADGRYISFQSHAENLVSVETNGTSQIYVKDLQTGAVFLMSATNEGVAGNSYSENSNISADGRFVTFQSAATNFVSGDTNGKLDIFVKDRVLGTVELVSKSTGGIFANDQSLVPVISSDGSHLSFHSYATNLVPDDTNGVVDVFAVTQIITPIPPAPEAPDLLSPTDMYNTDDIRPAFSWAVVPNAIKYTFEIKRIEDNSVVAKATYAADVRCDDVSCTIPSPVFLDPDFYKWHVVAYTITEKGTWSGYNRFLLVGLDTPRLRSPGVDATVYGGRPTFKWYPVPDATLHDLEIYKPDGSLYGEWTKGLAACTGDFCEFRIPDDLTSNYGDYQWRVRARSDADSSLWSDLRTFSYTRLERTWQISPDDSHFTQDTSPTLQWADITGATMYLMQFRLPDDTFVFNVLVDDDTYCNDTTCTWDVAPELALGSYKWHVRAKNGRNFGRWTAYRSIIISDSDQQQLLFEDFLGTSLPSTFRYTSNAPTGGYEVGGGLITIYSGIYHGGGSGIWSIESFSRGSNSELRVKMFVEHSQTNTGGWGFIEDWHSASARFVLDFDTNVLSGCVREELSGSLICEPFPNTVNPDQMYVYEIIISENKTTFIFNENSTVEVNAVPLSSTLYVYTDKMSPGGMTHMIIDSVLVTQTQ